MISCRRCGTDVGIVLLGAHDKKFKCSRCNTMSYGMTKCGDTDCASYDGEVSEIEEYEKIYCEVCDDCREELQAFRAESEKGGVYWKCTKCKMEGVIKAGVEFALEVRKHHGPEYLEGPPYLPCGLEFEGPPECPAPQCQEENPS